MVPDNNRNSNRKLSPDNLLKSDANPSFLERVKKLKREEYLQGFAKSQYITQTPTPTYSPTPSPTPTNTITVYPTPPITPTPTGIEDPDMFDEATENCISLSAQFFDGLSIREFKSTEWSFACIEQKGEFFNATAVSASLSSINKARICPVLQIESLSTTNLALVGLLRGQKEKSVVCAHHQYEFILAGGGGGGGSLFPTNPIEEASYCLTTTWEAILVSGSVFPHGVIPLPAEKTNYCIQLETEFLSAEAIDLETYVGDALKHEWSMCVEVSSQFLLAPVIMLDTLEEANILCIEPQCELLVAPEVEGEIITEDTNVCIFTYMELLTTAEAGTSATTLSGLHKAECCVTIDMEIQEATSASYGTSFVFYAPITEDNLHNTGDYISFAGTNAIFKNYDSTTLSYEFESFSNFINRRRLNPATSLPDRILEYTHDLCALKDLYQFNLNFPQGAGQAADEIGAFIAYPATINSIQTIIDADTTVYPVVPQTPITTQITIAGGAPTALMYGGTLYKLQRLSLQVPDLTPTLNVKINTCL